ncbi:MAG: lipopolysaccharide biosynthesis protein, partial [Candidatus Binatia bacterium]
MSPSSPRRLWSWFRTSVLGKKSIQDVGVLSAANVVSAALVLLQGLLLARWLGPQHYGTAALVLAYPYLVSGFLSPRSKEVSVKYVSEFHLRGDRRGVLAICKLAMMLDVLVALVTFLIVWLSAGWAAEHFTRDPEMAILMILVSASSVVGTLAGTSYAVLATLRRFELIAKLNAMTSVLNTGLMLSLVFCGWSVAGVAWGAALAAASSGLVHAGVAAAIIHRTWGGSPLSADLSVLSGRIRVIAGHFAYNHLSRVFLSVLGQLDLVVLGHFRGPTEAGYYKLAKRIATALWDLTTPLASVAYPAILRVVQGADDEAARQMIRKLALHLG